MLEEGIDSVLGLMEEEFRDLILKTGDSHVMWHHGFGTRIRNVLNLWDEDNALVKWFDNEYGLNHPDDISGILLAGAFCRLRGQPFDPMVQVKEYLTHWETFGK